MLSCFTGCLPQQGTTKYRNATAELLIEILTNFKTETHIKNLLTENISHRTTVSEAETPSDVAANGYRIQFSK